MVEELLVQIGTAWKQLELNSPSKVTLEYSGNLFGDISKISASHSYTFSLPMTVKNMNTFKALGDIRVTASASCAGTKLPARFIQNGVPLFNNAYLYITQITKDCYQAVLTWDVNDGLSKISHNDISINELQGTYYTYDGDEGTEKDDVVTINKEFTKYEDYSDDMQVVKTAHCAGTLMYDYDVTDQEGEVLSPIYFVHIPSSYDKRQYGLAIKYVPRENGHYMPLIPPPVMPVPYLLKQIENYYGIEFDFGDIFNKMVVPLVKKEMSIGLAKQNYTTIDLTSGQVTAYRDYDNDELKKGYLLFKNTDVTNSHTIEVNNMTSYGKLISTDYDGVCNSVVVPGAKTESPLKIIVEGRAEIYIKSRIVVKEGANLVMMARSYDSAVDEDELPDWEDIATVNGELANSAKTYKKEGYVQYIFDFQNIDGFDTLDIDDVYNTKEIKFQLRKNNDDADIIEIENLMDLTGSINIYCQYQESATYVATNVFKNLPDISCLNFIKAIMMAVGGYPVAQAGGKIGLSTYNNIKDNVLAGNIVNWSDRVLRKADDTCRFPEIDMGESTLSGNFAKKNYYLMKNDEINSLGQETQNVYGEDWYRHNYAKISIQSDLLEDFTTVYQSPFYGAFIANKTRYRTKTYNGQDYFHSTNGRQFTAQEAKPILAYIESLTCDCYQITTVVPTEDDPYTTEEMEYLEETIDLIQLKIWEFPASMSEDESYSYMSSIMTHPIVVKATMNLTELDLMNLDYQVPIYLEQYNSNFAIKKITRNSDGICDCEFIKLPNN